MMVDLKNFGVELSLWKEVSFYSGLMILLIEKLLKLLKVNVCQFQHMPGCERCLLAAFRSFFHICF